MMDYRATIRDLGSKDVTATFGCSMPPNALDGEIVGPLKPRSVHYGVTYGTDPDTDTVMTGYTVPLLHFDFNKYRPDLPPWEHVCEIVLAAPVEGKTDGPMVAHFINPNVYGMSTTGDLKTVTVAAEGPGHGTEELAIIDKYEIAKRRGMDGTRSGAEFRVDGVLE